MRYDVRTMRTPQDILDRAMVHFGPAGAGLHVVRQTMLGIVFEGGGGYVAVVIQPGADETVVELETREWDFPVRGFMAKIQQRRRWWHRWKRHSREVPPPSSPFQILDND